MTNQRRTFSAAHFLLGLAAGGAIALLYAPCSGRETRGKLRARMDEGKSKLADGAEQIRQRSNALFEQAEDMVETSTAKLRGEINRIESALQAGRAAYKRGVEA